MRCISSQAHQRYVILRITGIFTVGLPLIAFIVVDVAEPHIIACINASHCAFVAEDATSIDKS